MITIDKDSNSQILVVTVTELTTIENPCYLLVINSAFTNNTYRIQLPENSSENIVRYDEFILDTAVFNYISEGLYNYSIYQSSVLTYDENALGEAVEKGFMKVTSSTATETYISAPAVEGECQYVVYNSN
jgi:hypothetical protein